MDEFSERDRYWVSIAPEGGECYLGHVQIEICIVAQRLRQMVKAVIILLNCMHVAR